MMKLCRLLRLLTSKLSKYPSDLLLLSYPLQVLLPHGYLVEEAKGHIAPKHPLATPASLRGKYDLPGSLVVHVVRP